MVKRPNFVCCLVFHAHLHTRIFTGNQEFEPELKFFKIEFFDDSRVSYLFLKGSVAIFMFASDALVDISKQSFCGLSNCSIFLKYSRTNMQETNGNVKLKVGFCSK